MNSNHVIARRRGKVCPFATGVSLAAPMRSANRPGDVDQGACVRP